MRVGCGLLALLAASLAVAPAQEPTKDDLLEAVQARLKKTAEVAGPSVATVVVSRSKHYPRPPADAPWKLGRFDRKAFAGPDPSDERARLAEALDLSLVSAISDHGYAGGVVVDAAGLVLTPYHAIDGATKIYVHLAGADGKLTGSYADVHAADARSDLAVLKLLDPPAKLHPVTVADVRTADTKAGKATVFTGKLCVLMARPYSAAFGLGNGKDKDAPAAAFGSLTGVRYAPPKKDDAAVRHTEYGTFLEYDVKPHAAVTGGLLLNLSGEMIGLTNAAAVGWGAEFGPGYAVPADEYFRRILAVLRRGGEVEYGFLGVAPVNRGATVVDPTPLGPAALAGMRTGDRIERVDGHRVESFDDLLLYVGSALAGSRVTVEATRAGRPASFTVTLAKFPNELPYLASVRPDPVFGLRVDYGSMHPQQRRAVVGAGVCVREVAADSPAAKQFKALGDDPRRWLVTHVNGTEVGDPAQFHKAAAGRAAVKLTLYDPSAKQDAEVTLP
jgi:serine protease Do